MLAALRGVYGRLRAVPVLGGLLTRIVWALKGLLGRPITLPAPAGAAALAAPNPLSSGGDLESRLKAQIAVSAAAAEGLARRLDRLEARPAVSSGGAEIRDTARYRRALTEGWALRLGGGKPGPDTLWVGPRPEADVRSSFADLPFADGAFRRIEAEHVLDRTPPDHAGALLATWAALLADGGVLAITLPPGSSSGAPPGIYEEGLAAAGLRPAGRDGEWWLFGKASR